MISVKEKKKNKREYDKIYLIKNHQKRLLTLQKFSNTPKGHYKLLKRRGNKKDKLLISQSDFIQWYTSQERICFYCGIPEFLLIEHEIFSKVMGKMIKRLTIDRLDNNLPYQKGNMVLACFRCNQIKSDFFSPEEMKFLSNLFIKPKWKE